MRQRPLAANRRNRLAAVGGKAVAREFDLTNRSWPTAGFVLRFAAVTGSTDGDSWRVIPRISERVRWIMKDAAAVMVDKVSPYQRAWKRCMPVAIKRSAKASQSRRYTKLWPVCVSTSTVDPDELVRQKSTNGSASMSERRTDLSLMTSRPK